jgi:3-isopropylmalate dehydrogenase
LMLDTLGRTEDAARIEQAVEAAVHAGETTRDVGGTLGTRAAGDAILRRLR